MSGNDAAGISFAQPKNFEQRFDVAEKCAARLDMKTPVVIDSMDNQTAENYAAFPDRLYIIDMEGKVSYKGGRGPFGYKPREMEQTLLLLMMEAQIKARAAQNDAENQNEINRDDLNQTTKQWLNPSERNRVLRKTRIK